ncbi:hypothetical protein D3C78_1442030 [compost metagenome]
MRDADQFHISKHHAWTFFTVVHQHFNTLGAQLAVQLLRQLLHTVRFVHVHRQDGHLERCQIIWPYDATFVVVLLNRSSHNTRDPDTITTHRQDLVTTIFALNRSVKRLGIFGA